MSRKQPFTPSSLANRESLVCFTSLAPNYYRVAKELHGFVSQPPGNWPGHYYVFPAVIMFMSCLEAFFQERLALSRHSVERENADNREELLTLIDCLREGRAPYQDFKDWLKEIFRMYAHNGSGIDTNIDVYQDALALKELRNSVAHYNPMLIEHIKWPSRLEQVLRRANPEVLNSGWVTNLSCIEVADWAHKTVINVIIHFCEKSGAENPFASTHTDGGFKW